MVLIAASILYTSLAMANDLSGRLCYLTLNSYGIRLDKESTCYRPLFEDTTTEGDYSNLQPGDALFFTGKKISVSAVKVESISGLGLFRLIGNWRDNKGRYYNFADFYSLAIYDPSAIVKTESYNYELYPNTSQRWGLSITNKKTNNIGLLRQFNDTTGELHFEICLYENNLPVRKRVCSTLTRLKN